MTTSKTKELRASSGFVKDYYDTITSLGPKYAPNPSQGTLDAFLDIYKKDAIVAGAIDTVGEEAVRNGGYFIGSKSAVEKAEKLFAKLDFYTIAETHVKTQHIYGDSFIEVKHGDDGELEIHNLETTEMFIDYDVHGEITKYKQRPWNISPTGDLDVGVPVAKWNPDEVAFLPLKVLGSKKRSYFPLEPAIRSLTAREYGHYFLETVFKNFKPQTIYSTDNNISPEQTQGLLSAIRACDKDPSKKLLSIGPLDVKNTGMYDFKRDIVDILNYLRQEILTVTKVPGIYVGITGDSNRGVGEFEANAFTGHLTRLQRDIVKLAFIILKKANIKVEFRMKPPSIKSQTDVIDQAKKLRDMGYGDNIITKYLYDNGINVPIDAKFEVENTTSMDDYESRQGSGKGVTEGKYNLDETGRSDAGKAKQAETDSKLRAALTRVFRGAKK